MCIHECQAKRMFIGFVYLHVGTMLLQCWYNLALAMQLPVADLEIQKGGFSHWRAAPTSGHVGSPN